MSRTLTGRRQAARIARCTAPVADAWTPEYPEYLTFGAEREAEADVCFAASVAALTGTDPGIWLANESDGTETRRRLVAQGADAIVRTAPAELVEPTEPGCDFAEMEAEIANEAATDAAIEAAAATRVRIDKRADHRDRARELALEVYSEAELAAFGDDPMDAWGRDVRDAVERWSPFSATRRADARYVVRCADGTRRYGNGQLAD
ncbi:hypothetical protein ACFVFS_24045 [Kitasatospora sp. NPDC057692]|uniref:hypothetical protein n=1 Tax=Kitasatospora sp. NPDC057692 TaxID=3346215 RepID=UPI0036C0903F